MIKINLLPKIRKEEIKWRRINQFVIFYGIIMLMIFGIFTVFLLAVQIYLHTESAFLDQKIQEKQKSAKARELEILETKSKVFNEEVSSLDKIQIEHIYFSQILEECAEIIPKGVHLSVFDVQKVVEVSEKLKDKNSKNTGLKPKENLYKVNIIGKAKTREDILDFRDALEDSEYFQNPNLPLANLTKRHDVEFAIITYLKDDALRKY